MKKLHIKYITAFSLSFFLFTACSPNAPAPPDKPAIEENEDKEDKDDKPEVNNEEQQKIMKEFNELVKNQPSPSVADEFIIKNIENISKENASLMVNEFEDIQKVYLESLTDEYFENEKNQIHLLETGLFEFNYKNLDKIKYSQASDLIKKTLDNGFKVETAEAEFFPVIDYSFYNKYSEYVTDDVEDYIDIMAKDSDETPVKDAAIIISWDEVIKRALSAEEFLKSYPESEKDDEIKELHDMYLEFLYYGSANTPAFDYDSNILVTDLKKGYETLIEKNADNTLTKDITAYYDILKKNDFKLSNEVENARKEFSKMKTE